MILAESAALCSINGTDGHDCLLKLKQETHKDGLKIGLKTFKTEMS